MPVEMGLLSTTLPLVVQSFPSYTKSYDSFKLQLYATHRRNSKCFPKSVYAVSQMQDPYESRHLTRHSPYDLPVNFQGSLGRCSLSSNTLYYFSEFYHIHSTNYHIHSTNCTNSNHFLTTCNTRTSCTAWFATFPTWTSDEYWTTRLICNVIGILPRVS